MSLAPLASRPSRVCVRACSLGVSLYRYSLEEFFYFLLLWGGIFFSFPFPGGRIFRLFLFFIYFFSLFLLSEGDVLSFSFLLRSTLFLFLLLGVTLSILSVSILLLVLVFSKY